MSFAPLATADQNTPKIVTSIRPLHALALALMAGAGKPELLYDQAVSPHHSAIKPSRAILLQNADLVFWMGPQLETSLAKPLRTIAQEAKLVTLHEVSGQTLHRVREAHHHDNHGDNHGDDHGDEHGDEETETNDQFDPHTWLDPQNAKLYAAVMADELASIDPANATIYRNNAAALTISLARLTLEIQEALKSGAHRPYLTHHDAFQYFENRFGLVPVGYLAADTEQGPGVSHIKQLRQLTAQFDRFCIFTEPQLNPQLLKLVESENSITLELDPLGNTLPLGPELYENTIRELASQFQRCFEE